MMMERHDVLVPLNPPRQNIKEKAMTRSIKRRRRKSPLRDGEREKKQKKKKEKE
jgi:hypothetical protein